MRERALRSWPRSHRRYVGNRAVTSISSFIRGSTSPTTIAVAAGRGLPMVEKAEHKAVEGVRAESQDVMQRIGAFMAHSAIGKWLQQSAFKPKAVQKRATRWLATWQKVPDDVRDSLLAVAGLASEQQVLALHQELAALRAEMEIHFDDAPTTRRLVVAHPHN